MFAVQPFSQQDPRWKNILLGTDNSSTISKFGCLLTCLTMVVNSFGENETPTTLNDKMNAVGGFQGAFIIPAVLPRALPGIRYNKYIPCENSPAPMVEIDATLDSNLPVIAEVDYSPAPGLQSHWIVLYGRQDGNYLIRDPWPYPVESQNVLLTARYGFAGPPQNIIKAAIWIEASSYHPQPLPKPQPLPIPATGFAVYATVDDLALRQQPYISDDNLIKRVHVNTKIYVVEDINLAKAKIGQPNQWLNVQDTQDGFVGYTAAWYLSTEPMVLQPPIPTPPPTPPVPSPALILYTMVDSLALRAQRVISNSTLMKRLPLNSQLLAVDPIEQVNQKVGVVNQWIQVRDIEGDTGYAAAWYVSTSVQQPLGAQSSGTSETTVISPSALKDLVVRVNIDNLALRSKPLISNDTLVTRYPILTELLIIEPINQALPKLGIVNQWLNVRDIIGREGYVAAWYVVQRPPPGNI